MVDQHACETWGEVTLDFHEDMTHSDFRTWSSHMHSDFHVEQFWHNLAAEQSIWSDMQDLQWDVPEDAGGGLSYQDSLDREWSNMFDGDHIQLQINKFFQLDTGAADSKVEELADGSSGVLSGTKRVGGHEKDWRRSKEHHIRM